MVPQTDRKRLLMVPHLVRARSAYKDILRSFLRSFGFLLLVHVSDVFRAQINSLCMWILDTSALGPILFESV